MERFHFLGNENGAPLRETPEGAWAPKPPLCTGVTAYAMLGSTPMSTKTMATIMMARWACALSLQNASCCVC